MGNDGLDEAQVGIKILRRNINNLMAESEEELRGDHFGDQDTIELKI